MEFLGIGPTEILLIAIIAFIVLGPDRIPTVMRQLGKWIRQMREMAVNVTRDYNSDIRLLTGEITALQNEIRSIQRELGEFATGLIPDMTPMDLTQTIGPKTNLPAQGMMPMPPTHAADSTPPATPEEPPVSAEDSAML